MNEKVEGNGESKVKKVTIEFQDGMCAELEKYMVVDFDQHEEKGKSAVYMDKITGRNVMDVIIRLMVVMERASKQPIEEVVKREFIRWKIEEVIEDMARIMKKGDTNEK